MADASPGARQFATRRRSLHARQRPADRTETSRHAHWVARSALLRRQGLGSTHVGVGTAAVETLRETRLYPVQAGKAGRWEVWSEPSATDARLRFQLAQVVLIQTGATWSHSVRTAISYHRHQRCLVDRGAVGPGTEVLSAEVEAADAGVGEQVGAGRWRTRRRAARSSSAWPARDSWPPIEPMPCRTTDVGFRPSIRAASLPALAMSAATRRSYRCD